MTKIITHKKCVDCSVAHIGKEKHCNGEVASCVCECRHWGEKIKLYEDLNQSFKAAQEEGLIR